MIIKVKNADYSAVGFGKLPIVTAETLAIISALGKTVTNNQKVGLQQFLNEIAPIKSKIDILTLPCLASTKEKAYLNVLSLFQPTLSTGTLNDMVLTDAGLRRDYTITPQTSFTTNYLADTRATATNINAHYFLYSKNEGFVGNQQTGGNLFAYSANELMFGGMGAFNTPANSGEVTGSGYNYLSFITTGSTAAIIGKMANGARVQKTVSAVAGGTQARNYCALYSNMRNPVSIFSYGQYLTLAEIDVLETATKNFMTVLNL